MAGRTSGHTGHKGLPADKLYPLKLCRVTSRFPFGPSSGGGERAFAEQLWLRSLPLEAGLSRCPGLGGLVIKIMTAHELWAQPASCTMSPVPTTEQEDPSLSSRTMGGPDHPSRRPRLPEAAGGKAPACSTPRRTEPCSLSGWTDRSSQSRAEQLPCV